MRVRSPEAVKPQIGRVRAARRGVETCWGRVDKAAFAKKQLRDTAVHLGHNNDPLRGWRQCIDGKNPRRRVHVADRAAGSKCCSRVDVDAAHSAPVGAWARHHFQAADPRDIASCQPEGPRRSVGWWRRLRNIRRHGDVDVGQVQAHWEDTAVVKRDSFLQDASGHVVHRRRIVEVPDDLELRT